MKKRSFQFVVFCLVTLLAAAATGAGGDIEAWLDRTRVSLGETVQLNIKAEGGVSGEPDTSPLAKDFQVLGTSSSSSINIINGSMSRATTWVITLQPGREGELTIPPLSVDGRQTKPLVLTVTSTPSPQEDSGADIFIETEVVPDSPYAAQQVIYQVRLFHAVDIAEGGLSMPQPDNTMAQQLGKDRSYETNRNNRHYGVIERTYALFPQQAGKLAIAPPIFTGKVVVNSRRADPFNSFFRGDPFGMLSAQARPVRITGQEETLTVRPRPADAAGGIWLPADLVTLAEEWQPERGSIRVGEAITRTMTLTAGGQTGAALPDLNPGEVDGFKAYPDKPEVKTEEQGGALIGTSRQKIAFIPVSPGKYTLPEVKLPWWDLKEERLKVATLPAREITVLPGDTATAGPAAEMAKPTVPDAAAPPAATVASPPALSGGAGNDHYSPWAAIALALAAAWMCTLLLWWRERRQRARVIISSPAGTVRSPSPSAAKHRSVFRAACQAGDAGLARSALLGWAAATWPDNPPKGLAELAGRVDSTGAAEEIAALDYCLFSDNPPPWDGRKLALLLPALAASGRGSAAQKTILPPLYQ